MSFNYRFSIIPAGAIIDARLTPRALQVLCLLGRHTSDNGWCYRSQVKMAKELNCGRSTIYDALELLFGAGWVEKRANGRGKIGPETSDHPFAAFSYRVILDRENLPDAIAEDRPNAAHPAPPSRPQNGAIDPAAIPAPPAAIPAGGAGEAAPLEGISSQGISTEPERESARAREKRARGLAAFEQRWPTAAVDDRGRTSWAWNELTEDDHEAALAGIGPFLDDLKRHKRTAVPAAWKYLEQRKWSLLDQKSEPSPNDRFIARHGSDEWCAWDAFYHCCGYVSGIPDYMRTNQNGVVTANFVRQWPPDIGRNLPDRSEWKTFHEGSPNFAAWRNRLREVPNIRLSATVTVPFDWPPNRGSTDPPPATPETLATEQDAEDFVK